MKPLNRRKRQVLRAYAEGKCTKEIAMELGVSPKTVEWHRAKLYELTGLNNIALLTQYALKHKIAKFLKDI